MLFIEGVYALNSETRARSASGGRVQTDNEDFGGFANGAFSRLNSKFSSISWPFSVQNTPHILERTERALEVEEEIRSLPT